LFEAINQGSLKGVAFLIESGVDPTTENKCSRTPLDFAEYLASEYPEELERLATVDFLRDWDRKRYIVDDATIVATARKIWGLMGGGPPRGEVETKDEQHVILNPVQRVKPLELRYMTAPV
jgi:hypothetical protein